MNQFNDYNSDQAIFVKLRSGDKMSDIKVHLFDSIDTLDKYNEHMKGTYICGNQSLLPAMSFSYFSIKEGSIIDFIPHSNDDQNERHFQTESLSIGFVAKSKLARAKLYDMSMICHEYRNPKYRLSCIPPVSYYFTDTDLKLDYGQPQKPSEEPLPFIELYEYKEAQYAK